MVNLGKSLGKLVHFPNLCQNGKKQIKIDVHVI